MGVKACPKGRLGGLRARGRGNLPPQMLNFEPLEGLEKLQSRSVCRCWGLRLGRVRGVCECEGLPVLMHETIVVMAIVTI